MDRHPEWVLDALANLPLNEVELSRLEQRAAGQTPVTSGIQNEMSWLRRANRTARSLAALNRIAPIPPLDEAPENDGVLERIFVAEGLRAEQRLQALLRDTILPVAPPSEIAPPDGVLRQIVSSEGLRAEQRLETLLRDTIRPVVVPPELSGDAIADVCSRLIEDRESALRSAEVGDLLAAGFTPLTAPGDADWAAAALESFEIAASSMPEGLRSARRPGEPGSSDSDRTSRIGGLSFGPLGSPLSPSRAPGWLWARIRNDVRGRVRTLQRRRAVVRGLLVAAALLISGLVWMQIASSSETAKPNIVFQRVDTPLSAQHSTSALIRSMRRGS